MDRIAGTSSYLRNPFNPGGVEATLRKWWTDPSQSERWIVFDGVSVMLVDQLTGLAEGWRSISLVRELSSVFGDNAHLTLNEFLYNDF
jgi:hypothetical protein